jgi:hypothetical protein
MIYKRKKKQSDREHFAGCVQSSCMLPLKIDRLFLRNRQIKNGILVRFYVLKFMFMYLYISLF